MKTSFNPKKLVFKSLLLCLIFVFASCEKESIPETLQTADANANASPSAQKSDATIADIVVSFAVEPENVEDREFTLLLAALNYTGLTGMFAENSGQYTVFAPTDAAFIDLLGEDPDLNDYDPAFIADILTYHVVEGRRFSNSVLGKKNWKEIETLEGSSIYVNSMGGIDTDDEDMEVNSSILVGAELFDIPASNGVIHVIDTVLIPTED